MGQYTIAYSDEKKPFTGRPVPYHEQDAVRHWTRHYENSKMIDFVQKSPLATFQERARARTEAEICARKMAHWQRHANWDASAAAAARETVDRKWR